MNNSVYGNPSSLTIQNDKKKGKFEIIFSLCLTQYFSEQLLACFFNV